MGPANSSGVLPWSPPPASDLLGLGTVAEPPRLAAVCVTNAVCLATSEKRSCSEQVLRPWSQSRLSSGTCISQTSRTQQARLDTQVCGQDTVNPVGTQGQVMP